MTVVAVMMVRDEEDIVGTTVRHLLEHVDAVVVADNLSTDSTPEILDDLVIEVGHRLLVKPDPDPAYRQSAKMSALAEIAHRVYGAQWIVPVDADEIWYSPFAHRMADVLADVPARWHVVPANLFDHVATGIDDADLVDPVRRLQWRRRAPAPLPKVACRWRPDLVVEQGNHGAHYDEFEPARFDPVLVVRHFPYRSPEQFLRKVRNGAAAYRAAGDSAAPNHGTHWRQWGDILDQHGPEAVVEIFHRWYYRGNPRQNVTIETERQDPLLHDPAPVVP